MPFCDSQGQIWSCKREDAGTREISEPSNPRDAAIKRQKFHLNGKYKAIMGPSLCSAENKWEIGWVCQDMKYFQTRWGWRLWAFQGSCSEEWLCPRGTLSWSLSFAAPPHLRWIPEGFRRIPEGFRLPPQTLIHLEHLCIADVPP